MVYVGPGCTGHPPLELIETRVTRGIAQSVARSRNFTLVLTEDRFGGIMFDAANNKYEPGSPESSRSGAATDFLQNRHYGCLKPYVNSEKKYRQIVITDLAIDCGFGVKRQQITRFTMKQVK